jgi:hypothetical protein
MKRKEEIPLVRTAGQQFWAAVAGGVERKRQPERRRGDLGKSAGAVKT